MHRFVILFVLGAMIAACADDKATAPDEIQIIAETPQNEKTLTDNIWQTHDATNTIRILRLDSTIKGWQALSLERSNCRCILYLPLNKNKGHIDYRNRDTGNACQLLPKVEVMQIPIDEVEKCKKQTQFKSFTFIAGIFTLYDPIKKINQVFY